MGCPTPNEPSIEAHSSPKTMAMPSGMGSMANPLGQSSAAQMNSEATFPTVVRKGRVRHPWSRMQALAIKQSRENSQPVSSLASRPANEAPREQVALEPWEGLGGALGLYLRWAVRRFQAQLGRLRFANRVISFAFPRSFAIVSATSLLKYAVSVSIPLSLASLPTSVGSIPKTLYPLSLNLDKRVPSFEPISTT